MQIEVVVTRLQLVYKGLKSRRSNRLWDFFNSKMGHFFFMFTISKIRIKNSLYIKNSVLMVNHNG